MNIDYKKLIAVATGKILPDFVIKNCRIVNVYSEEIEVADIAISGEYIAGVGNYDAENNIDGSHLYAAPGFIDSHIHIESSFLCPEELGRLLVPHGTTTIIADPHEIVNVCGVTGLDYMMYAAQHSALDIKFMLPSCVPSTPFEHAGALLDAQAMKEPLARENILGLGEYMNFPGIINGTDADIAKIELAHAYKKLIDGHAPGLAGKELNAYICAGILGDHECDTIEGMKERIAKGMYVLLREGSACHNLRPLLKGVDGNNYQRCLLCSDDCQPKTIFSEGHIDNHLRICIEEGIDPIHAIKMATLNAAQAFRLYDRGAIAPGKRADIVLLDNLKRFNAQHVFIKGKLVAQNSNYLPAQTYEKIDNVRNKMNIEDFSEEKLCMHLKSTHVHAIEIVPGGVTTKKSIEHIELNSDGDFIMNPAYDLVKVAVVERHHATGNVACALLKGYGLKEGALAISIAHDSHNIIVVGASNREMKTAVDALIEQEGGIVLIKNGEIIENMPLPIAGLMTNKGGQWVADKLESIHEKAFTELGIHKNVEPIMTLCFMSLPVIPEVKLTDMGLFDVNQFKFIPIETDR